jgi:hypothetical protein
MCYHISAVVGGVGLEGLHAAMRDASPYLRFDEVSNPPIGLLLASDEAYLVRVDTHCDCGTWLGSANRAAAGKYAVTHNDVAKPKAKGWGSQRIQRWEAERLKATALAKSKELQDSDGRDSQPWVGVVREALEVAKARSFGLLLHWYSGPMPEPIDATRREFTLADLDWELLAGMPEDTLYSFTRR